MDRLKSWHLACGGLVMALGMSGCKSPRPEVPREPPLSGAAQGSESRVGFSSEAHPTMGTPFPNGAPGTQNMQGGMYGGAPTFSPSPPPSSGQLATPPSAAANPLIGEAPVVTDGLSQGQPGVAGGAAAPR